MLSYPNDGQSESPEQPSNGKDYRPDQLALAHRYIARGWHPCPLEPNSKIIREAGWPEKDYISLPQLYFRGGNIGVKLGTASAGLMDVDLDCEEALELADHFLPQTGAVFGRKSTPRAHWLYNVGADAPGTRQFKAGAEKYLELRGTGAQTMFPGSIHPNGELVSWDHEGEPAKLSYDELLWALKKLFAGSVILRHAPKNGRHDYMLALTGWLVGQGWTEAETEDLLLPIYRRMVPDRKEDPADELARMVAGATAKVHAGDPLPGLTKAKEMLGEIAAKAVASQLGLSGRVEAEDSFPREPLEPSVEAAAEASAAQASTSEPAPAEKPKRKAQWAHDIQPTTKHRWLVKKLIPRSGFGILYGESQAGKTFLAVDLACRLALGWNWFGRKVEPGTVVYLAAEAPESVKNRIYGWRRYHRHEGPLWVLVVPPPFNFYTDLKDADEVVSAVRNIVVQHGAPPVVALMNDTMPRTFGGGSENKAEDMSKVLASHEHISRGLSCTVIGVHHTGKDASRGPRGSYALFAGVDFSMFAEAKDDGVRVLKFDKERDGRAERFGYSIKIVEIGEDEDGEQETTCVVVEAELPAEDGELERLPKGKNQLIVLRTIDMACMFDDATARDPEIAVAPRGLILQHFTARYLEENPGTEPKHIPVRFTEALDALTGGENPFITVEGEGDTAVLRTRRALASRASAALAARGHREAKARRNGRSEVRNA